MTAALSESERLVRDALTVAYNAGAEHEVRIYEIDDDARDLVAALRPLLAADPSGLCTTCRDCGLCCAYGHLRCWLHADDGGDRDLRDQLCPPAGPEIVTGKQARELPYGSIFVECHMNGVPMDGHTVVTVGWEPTIELTPEWRYVVLHRAPAPAPKVGDVVRTEAELDRLPLGAAIRDADGDLREHRREGWPGITDDDGVALPATVLDLGSAAT